MSTDKSGDEFYHKDTIPCRAINAVLPIVTMVLTVIVGLFISGEGETITDIIGSADPYARADLGIAAGLPDGGRTVARPAPAHAG